MGSNATIFYNYLPFICEFMASDMHHVVQFQVDSHEFPGQKHRWLLTQLLLKGQIKAHETLLDDLAKALYLIGV